MTMAEATHNVAYPNNNDYRTIVDKSFKQRKRKRLSQVLDRLTNERPADNNNTIRVRDDILMPDSLKSSRDDYDRSSSRSSIDESFEQRPGSCSSENDNSRSIDSPRIDEARKIDRTVVEKERISPKYEFESMDVSIKQEDGNLYENGSLNFQTRILPDSQESRVPLMLRQNQLFAAAFQHYQDKLRLVHSYQSQGPSPLTREQVTTLPNTQQKKTNKQKACKAEERTHFPYPSQPYDEDDDVFSKSPHSSSDSPRISFSPLRIKEEPSTPTCTCSQCQTLRRTPSSPSSTVSSPYSLDGFLHHKKPLPDLSNKRSHSDSDLPFWFSDSKVATPWTLRKVPQPSVHAEHLKASENPQEFPLDLSVKRYVRGDIDVAMISSSVPFKREGQVLLPTNSYVFNPHGNPFTKSNVSVPIVKGDVASRTTKESVASRYNLEVSPVVEEMPPGSDVAFVCPICGQMFSLHDRLAKHMASRHKSRTNENSNVNVKAYLCEVCQRSFARSDMLTRHMRLHTGVKPYTCRVCSQVFSRSDHLSTHQRTHTGEKPYKCPQCPYAACRRDMITRHMRTHVKYEPVSSSVNNSRMPSPSSTTPRSQISFETIPKTEITTYK